MFIRTTGFGAGLAVAVALAVCGCSGEKTPGDSMPEVPEAGSAIESLGDPEPAPPGQSEEASTPEEPIDQAVATQEAEVLLKVLDWEQTRGLVAEHAGKVVVMDLWSTFCPPCVAEFPHLVELQHELGDQVVCISVSLDYEGFDDMPVDSYIPKVMAFLKKQKSTLTNVLLSTDSETLFSQIEHSSMPIVYVFDQSGNLAGQFPDPKNPSEFTYAVDVRPLVLRLLGRDGGSTGAGSTPASSAP